jgi:hypothetical protein
MIKHAVTFYKQLFGREDRASIRLGSDFWKEEDKISEE